MIKLFLTDVDGTLTDGVYSTNEEGIVHKNFYTRDFHGLHMLKETGMDIGIISYSKDCVINKQADRAAKYAKVMTGVKDKLKFITEHVKKDLNWDEIAYIGDDTIDEELLAKVGVPACPYDAYFSVIRLVENHKEGFKSAYCGGKGAVRDFAEYIIALNSATVKE